MMWYMGHGWGWWMALGWIWMVVFWGLIIWAVYTLVSRLSGGSGTTGMPWPSAREILEQRYARGELTHEEFEEMRRRLDGSSTEKVAER